ncbi:MAG: glycosyltransferase family 2 protein [Firmicutes bacterium]|nr:glycosyltransferase family 2 protein [Bacillota bacterium]
MKVVAIIPAYNEAERIGGVLEVLQQVAEINEIIVVSDGSEDNTVEVALGYNVTVIALPQNIGKGGAMKIGSDYSHADVFLFLDADLVGLRLEHVVELLTPVLEDQADMTIGIFGNGRIATDFAQKVAPFLSGQRAVKGHILKSIDQLDATRYGVEVALTKYAEESGIKVVEVALPDLTHVMKEEKLGFVRGFCARLKMYWEIVKSVKIS